MYCISFVVSLIKVCFVFIYDLNKLFETFCTCWFVLYASITLHTYIMCTRYTVIHKNSWDSFSNDPLSITVEIQLNSLSSVLLPSIFLKGDEKSGLFEAIKPGSRLSYRIQKSTVSRESSNGSFEIVLGTKGPDEVCILFVPSTQTVSVEDKSRFVVFRLRY